MAGTAQETAKSSTIALDGNNSMEQSKNTKVNALTKCSTKGYQLLSFYLTSFLRCTDLMDRSVIYLTINLK